MTRCRGFYAGMMLAAAAATMAAMGCHKGTTGSTSASNLATATNPLNGKVFQVLLSVNSYTWRRTGGCLLDANNTTVSQYDGCTFPASGGYASVDVEVFQNGKTGLLRFHDKSRDGTRDNNLSGDLENCWGTDSADPADPIAATQPDSSKTTTPCFIPPGTAQDYFEISGTFSYNSTNSTFRFQGFSTQRFFSATGATLDNWFPSNGSSIVWASESANPQIQRSLGGWPERIRVETDLTFFQNGSVNGSFLWQDRDPDHTATQFCTQSCLIRSDMSTQGTTKTLSLKNFYAVHADPDRPTYYDLFPYCNPDFLTSGPTYFAIYNTNTALSELRPVCTDDGGFITCPPFVTSTWAKGLREFPFCGYGKDLPCSSPPLPADYVEEHCTGCGAGHPNSSGSFTAGGIPVNNLFDEVSQLTCIAPNPLTPCTSTKSGDWINCVRGCIPGFTGFASTTTNACRQGPMPCCADGSCDASFLTCQRSGVRALSRAPYSSFYSGPALDYSCPHPPGDNSTYPTCSGTNTRRNVLIPFRCESANNKAENCPADDVYILFGVSSASLLSAPPPEDSGKSLKISPTEKNPSKPADSPARDSKRSSKQGF